MAMNQGMKYEVPIEMRDFAEKSVEQARKAFGGFLGAAHKAVETLEGSSSTMQASANDATRKTLTYAEQNITADFTKAQFAAIQGQMKELGEMAQSAARTASSQAASVASHAAATVRSAADQATSAMGQAANQAARSTES